MATRRTTPAPAPARTATATATAVGRSAPPTPGVSRPRKPKLSSLASIAPLDVNWGAASGTIPDTGAVLPSLAAHPLTRRHYRVGTSAIEEMVDLVMHCLKLRIPGALVYARPRMGKTHAIDYVALHLARHCPDVLVLRMSCEHHRSDFEGPFFSTLLNTAGARQPFPKNLADKRFALLSCISEQLQIHRGYVAVLMCDEAQRLSKHGLEWLRDVHDQLAQHGYRLITFLVGQPQLMTQRAEYQASGDEQIVARFMIEHLNFRGVASPQDAATCLASYDLSRYPEQGGPTFTSFFYPCATAAGFRLERSAAKLWNAFVQAHDEAQLSAPLEIPMDYFTRAVETVLLQGPQWDCIGLELNEAHWAGAQRGALGESGRAVGLRGGSAHGATARHRYRPVSYSAKPRIGSRHT